MSELSMNRGAFLTALLEVSQIAYVHIPFGPGMLKRAEEKCARLFADKGGAERVLVSGAITTEIASVEELLDIWPRLFETGGIDLYRVWHGKLNLVHKLVRGRAQAA